MIRTFVQRSSPTVLLTLTLALAGSAFQMPAGAAQPATTPSKRIENSAERALEQQTARQILRTVLLDLRASTPPTPSDYAFASTLLEVAADLDPSDANIARYRAEAAFNAGDAAGVIEATRKVLEADPTDTVALLRLITARVNQLQTVEARIDTLASFVGPKGDRIDPSVRSRLALDAALLCREASNDEGFVRFVRQAAKLDSTNKDAALLVFQHYCQQNDNPMGRLELLANLLYADPLDPGVHRMIRDELIASSAFEAAKRFHSVSEKISTYARAQPTAAEVVESVCMNWRTDGAKATFETINRSLMTDRDGAARELALLDPVLQLKARKPEEIRLSFDYEEIRLGAAILLEDRAAIDASLRDLEATTAETLMVLSNPDLRDPSMTETFARSTIGDQLVGLQIWRCIANRDLEKIEADVPKLDEYTTADNESRKTLEVWRAVRFGDADAGRAAFESGPDNIGVDLARGIFEQSQGNIDAAAAAFMAVSNRAPLGVPGVIGWSRAEQVKPGITAPSPLTRQMAAYAQTIPKWIDAMVDTPRMTQTLAVDISPIDPQATEPSFASIVVRNIAPIPLGVGSDRVINSRLLFTPNLERKDGVSQLAEPEFVEINRRLRLMPGEMLTTKVWPEVGLTGMLADVGCAGPIRLRWRVIQGFESGTARTKQAGPGCQETGTATLLRKPLYDASMPVAELVAAIGSASEDRWPVMLFAARAGMLGPVLDRRLGSDNQQIVRAIADRYAGLNPTLRAMTLALIPPVALAADTAPLDAAIVDEADPKVLAVAIVTRCAKADNPLLVRALESTDTRVAKLAALQKERLTAGTKTYASTGFGAEALTPAP